MKNNLVYYVIIWLALPFAEKFLVYVNSFEWFTIKAYMHTLYLLCHVKEWEFSLDLENLNKGRKL